MNRLEEAASNGAAANKYAAIYVRVSTEDQGKGFSIPTQIEACHKLAAQEGYMVAESHVLVDEGISGTTMERPGLRKLRDLVNAYAIVAVIVYDPDRLSRNLGHQLLLAEEFERASVKLLIVSHPMEQGPEGWLFFQMRGALAEYERAKLMERTHRGRIGRAQAENPWGGQVLLGYRAVREPHKARWDIDEEEAALVRRIFAMCLSGMSTYGITEELTKERVPTCRERLAQGGRGRMLNPGVWNEASVHKILTNEAYMGRAYWGKYRRVSKTTPVLQPRSEWIAIPVPAIIDESTFHAVQGQLRRNQEQSPRNRKHAYLLSGRFRCGRCGRTMTGSAPYGIRRYRCNSLSVLHDAQARCRGSVNADEAEARVWAAVEDILRNPELVAAEVAKQQEHAQERCAELLHEASLIDDALAKCDREEERWAQAYAAEVINLGELKGYRAEIGARRRSLLDQRQTLEAQREAINHTVDEVEALTTYCGRVRQQLQTFDDQEKRRAFDALNMRVTWTPGQPLTIEGSIPLDEIIPIASSRYFG